LGLEGGRARSKVWMVVAGLVMAGVVGGVVWYELKTPPFEHVDTVIADLDNETGDADFDHTLNKVVQIDLQQSPFFTVVGDGRARKALTLMDKPAGQAMTAPLAREVCQRLNGQVYVVPGIASVGKRYLISLAAMSCADGKVLGARRKEVGSKDEVLGALSVLIEKVRRDVGESSASLKEFDKPLYEEKTSSLEALKAYSEATRLGDAGKYPESIAMYKRAIELDPQFAAAWADMGTMYYNESDKVHAVEAVTKAYAMRDTVNERERLYIEYNYSQNVSGDLQADLQALRQWTSMYPEDNIPLGGLINLETWTGQYAVAAALSDKIMELQNRHNVHNGISYEIAARAYHHANMPDKLRAVYADALKWKVDTQGMHSVMLEYAAENGNELGVQEQVAWAKGTAAESYLLQEVAMASLADGRVEAAESLFHEATVAAHRDGVEDSLFDLDDYHVRMLVDMGMTTEAKASLKTLGATDPSLDKAFTEAEVGSADEALAAAEKALEAAPNDTLIKAEYLPSVRAAIALREGKANEAVAMLQTAEPYEMRDPTVPYLRGQAYLMARRGAEAEVEFEKIAGQPWLADPAAPLINLAELGVARSLTVQGKNAQAEAAYKKFLAAWSGADVGLPVVVEAKAELQRLESAGK